VQYWLENEGPMKDAPMLAEMLVLLVAVPETVGAHQKAQSKLTKCYAAMVQKAQSAGMQAPWLINQYIRKTLNYLFCLNPILTCLKWHIK
jgi:hypothetical protein